MFHLFNSDSLILQYLSDFTDSASGVRIVETASISTSWNTREKSSEIDNDHSDPLFHTEDFQPFVDSDEGESSGMYSSV